MKIIEKLKKLPKFYNGNGQLSVPYESILSIIEEYKNAQEPVFYTTESELHLSAYNTGVMWPAYGNVPAAANIPLFTHPPLSDETVKVPDGYALVPIEPTEKIIQAYVDNLGGIVGTPEALANPEFIERNKQRQRKAGISHYRAMIDEAMKADK